MPIFTSADCLLQVIDGYNVHLVIHSKDLHVHDESIEEQMVFGEVLYLINSP